MAKDKAPRTVDAQTALTSDLGYHWSDPPAPTPLEYGPFWRAPLADPIDGMADELTEAEWRVAHLREEIQKLGGEPKGRTRRDLSQQLATLFLDRERLSTALAALSENDRQHYAYILLQTILYGYYTSPDFRGHLPNLTRSGLSGRISKAKLALTGEDGGLIIPFGTYQRLPPLHVPLTPVPEPQDVVPAANPRIILSQIQQLLGFLQSERSALRPRPHWQAPEYPYAQPVTCWPPTPDDARALIQYPNRHRALEFWPPEPYLDAPSLQAWSEVLGVSETWAEFLYHILVASGILWSGSPLTLDANLTQAWLALPSGRQLSVIYRLYRNIAHWAVWWPSWRAGKIRVRRAYQGYWGLMSVDESIRLSSTNLRWVLLEALSFLPHETWLSLADVQQWLIELFPEPETHRYLMGLQLETLQGDWRGFLAAAIRGILTGPLYGLGLVDIGPSLEDVRAIRLHNLQGLQWGRLEEIPLETAGTLRREAVRFLPDLPGIEVETPVPPDFMTFLLQWAKPAGLSRILVRYELDVGRLHRAFEQGESPETLGETWERAVGFGALPEIAAWWRQWWSRYGRVRLYPDQAILQTRDDFTMHELQVSLPTLQDSILGMVTPTTALLQPKDVDQIVSDLARQGYMPKDIP